MADILSSLFQNFSVVISVYKSCYFIGNICLNKVESVSPFFHSKTRRMSFSKILLKYIQSICYFFTIKDPTAKTFSMYDLEYYH